MYTFNKERNELIITSKRTSGIGKSLLGDSFREAQTDDCSLIINLNNGITSIDSRYVSGSPEVWYTIDGRVLEEGTKAK